MSAKSPLEPIRIQINRQGGKPYKSIDQIDWENVPPFAVLTGVNGSGKTQLLELLAIKLMSVASVQQPELQQFTVTITGDSFPADGVTFIPSHWQMTGPQPAGVNEIQQAKANFYGLLTQTVYGHDTQTIKRQARARSFLGTERTRHPDFQEFEKLLPADFSFALDDNDLTQGMGQVFLAHRLRMLVAMESGADKTTIERSLGPAPWDVLNEIFRAADFPYLVDSPVGKDLANPYVLTLVNPVTNQMIPFGDLSSGEKVLLGLVLWLYNSQHHHRFPKFFLLDEPDAHLHPSMTHQLLSVLREVLVERYGVRVILTTHSPSTVALAPEGSVFEMFKDAPRIRPSTSQASSIGLLTAGLVTVSPSTRYTLVEDSDDVSFYNTVRNVLTDYGPSRDPKAIKPEPSIVFLPASNRSGAATSSGGKTVVEGWVSKFDQAPLNEVIRGVIDRDQANVGNDRVYPIGRYSFENYLLDPFVVFGVLLSGGTAPNVPGIFISSGDEHLLRSMTGPELQSIADVIFSVVEPILQATGKTADATLQSVHFTTDQTVNYPKWALDFRGHDLLPAFQSAFGGPKTINQPRLEGSFRRVRLIPVELVDVMNKLQT